MNSTVKKAAAGVAAALLVAGFAAPMAQASTDVSISVNGKVWVDGNTLNVWANHDEITLSGKGCIQNGVTADGYAVDPTTGKLIQLYNPAEPAQDYNLWVWYKGVGGESSDSTSVTLSDWDWSNVGINSSLYQGKTSLLLTNWKSGMYLLPAGDAGIKADGSWTFDMGKVPAGKQAVGIACVGYNGDVKFAGNFVINAVTPTIDTDKDWSIDLSKAFTVWGKGYLPGEQVTLTVASDPNALVTVTADADGYVQAVVTLPAADQTGTHTLTWTGADSGRTASLTYVAGAAAVAPTTSAPAGTLPGFTTDI